PRPLGEGRLRVPEGLELAWTEREDPPVECRLPYAAVSAGHFVRKEALKPLFAEPGGRHAAYQDERGRAVAQIVASRGERVLQVERRPLPEGASIALDQDGRAVREWLLESARKGHDGFMARVFDRHLSLAVSRRLLDTSVTPNQMTIFSTLLGLLGCVLFLGPTPAWDVVGALLVWLHSVLDGCDGELARLKHMQSRLGGILDFWGDNIVHVALFSCLGLSRYWTHGQPLYLGLAALASLASAGSAWLAFKNAFRPAADAPGFGGLASLPVHEGPAVALKRVEDALAQRDFIYLLVLVAIFGRQDLFLWCGAIGAPLFFIVLVYLTAQSQPVDSAALSPSHRGHT
ncbi:MAG: CDP-alcohol phosphatidyltransferase family protein, partial [Elusimicrobia bacterium]|nr:CDP-alcohol phosphatidyltransferase family protein [Elusimicrobiota bacterium]